jgi:hypothetical protein
MTAVTQVYIQCDGTVCAGDATGEYAMDASTIAQARRVARRLGWVRAVDGRDLCPKCADVDPQVRL